jgi:hypothetical protein
MMQQEVARLAPLSDVRFTLIASVGDLEAAAARLLAATAVGVDVEHSPKSFHGFVCTVQLSTPDEDFLVDCMVPQVRHAFRTLLGPLLWATSVLKVFHSASNDMRWLSSNFGVAVRHYVDTGVLAKLQPQASTDGGPAGKAQDNGLAALLMTHFRIKSDKRFQRADWRLRPIPAEMLAYARTDTRYLLPLAVRLLFGAAGLADRAPNHGDGGVGAADAAGTGTEAGAPRGVPGASGAAPLSAAEETRLRTVLTDALARSSAIAQQRYDRREKERFHASTASEFVRSHAIEALSEATRTLRRHHASRASVAAGATVADAGAQAHSEAAAEIVHVAGSTLAEHRCAAGFLCMSGLRHAFALQHNMCPDDLAERELLLQLAALGSAHSLLRARAGRPLSGLDRTDMFHTPGTGDEFLQSSLFAELTAGWPSDFIAGTVAVLQEACRLSDSAGAELHYSVLQGRVHVDAAGVVHRLAIGADSAAGAGSPSGKAHAAASIAAHGRSHPGAAGDASSPAAAREARKAARAEGIFVPRATPLYNNIELLAPDGTVLARIDKKKAQWYLDMGLVEQLGDAEAHKPGTGGPSGTQEGLEATAVHGAAGATDTATTATAAATGGGIADPAAAAERAAAASGAGKGGARVLFGAHTRPEDGTPPLRLRLKHAPKGLGHSGDRFHLAEKRNECVVCGIGWEAAAAANAGLNRGFVVPHGLRQYFPLAAKSYTSHDVVLTCARCHRLLDLATAKMMRSLMAEFRLPSSTKEAAAQGLTTEAQIATLFRPVEGAAGGGGAGGGEGADADAGAATTAVGAADAGSGAEAETAGASSEPLSEQALQQALMAGLVALKRDAALVLRVLKAEATIMDEAAASGVAGGPGPAPPVAVGKRGVRPVGVDDLGPAREAAGRLRAAEWLISIIKARGAAGGTRPASGSTEAGAAGGDAGGGDDEADEGEEEEEGDCVGAAVAAGHARPSRSAGAAFTDAPTARLDSAAGPSAEPSLSSLIAPLTAPQLDVFVRRKMPIALRRISRALTEHQRSRTGVAHAPPLTARAMALAARSAEGAALPPDAAAEAQTAAAAAVAHASRAAANAAAALQQRVAAFAREASAAAAASAARPGPLGPSAKVDTAGDAGSGSAKPPPGGMVRPVAVAGFKQQEVKYDPSYHLVRSILLADWRWRAAEPNFPPLVRGDGWLPAQASVAEAATAGAGTDATDGGARAEPAGVSGLPVSAEDRIARLVQRWRANFLACVQPRCLPDGWSVGYKVFQGGLRKDGVQEAALVREVAALLGPCAPQTGGDGTGAGHAAIPADAVADGV